MMPGQGELFLKTGEQMPARPFERLRLPGPLCEAMLAQALAERPLECCGVLAGLVENGVGQVVARYPLLNSVSSPVEYASDPKSMFDATRDMRERGLEMLAVYHSHPSSPPVPSKTDLARNYSEDVVNFIVSLTTSPPILRGWWLTETDYREAEWEIT